MHPDQFGMDTADPTYTASTEGHAEGEQSLWWVGVILVIFSSLVGAFGDNYVRLSFLREDMKPEELRRPMVKRPMWIFGTFLSTVLNTALVISALAFTSPAITTPFAGLHIAWNIPVAYYMLQEKVTKVDLLGSAVIMLGIVLVVAFGSHHAVELTVDSIEAILTKPSMVIYFFILFIALFVCGLATYLSNPDNATASAGDKSNTNSIANGEGLGLSTAATGTSLDSPDVHPLSRSQSQKEVILGKLGSYKVGMFCCSLAAGLWGGNTNVFAKGVLELLGREGGAAVGTFVGFFVCAFTICCALCQLFFLNESLRRYEAVYCVPIINAGLVGTAAIASNVMFDDYKYISTADFFLFLTGATMVIGGILSLCIFNENKNPNNGGTVVGGDDKAEERQGLQARGREVELHSMMGPKGGKTAYMGEFAFGGEYDDDLAVAAGAYGQYGSPQKAAAAGGSSSFYDDQLGGRRPQGGTFRGEAIHTLGGVPAAAGGANNNNNRDKMKGFGAEGDDDLDSYWGGAGGKSTMPSSGALGSSSAATAKPTLMGAPARSGVAAAGGNMVFSFGDEDDEAY